MKYISNNEADGVLERLLKAEIGRASRAGAPCSQFDPDFSTAYIERNLTPGEISRYEFHLAECPFCRIRVAGLARLGYQPDLAQEPETARSSRPLQALPHAGLSRIWSYLLQPQWIAVATAALVLLIGVPVFIIQRNAEHAKTANAAPSSESRDTPGLFAGKPGPSAPANGVVASTRGGRAEQPGGPTAILNDKETAPAGTAASTSDEAAKSADVNGRVAVANPAPDAPAQKTETENRQSGGDRVVGAAGTQVAQNSPQQSNGQQTNQEPGNFDRARVTATAAALSQEKQQAKSQPAASATEDDRDAAKRADQAASSEQISPKEAQTLPNDKKAEVSVLKPAGGSADGTRAKDSRVAIRSKDSEPPKAESTRDEPERRAIAKGPAREFATKGKSDAESVRKQPASPPLSRSQRIERRVEGKRFRLLAGIWTDKDFKPDKEIPAVTLIRDGELYKSALEKQPGLKALLTSFAPDERVIVVYKNIIYKVLPSKD